MSGPADVLAPHCGPGCITCGDVAVSLRVRHVDTSRGLALCEDEDGRTETVEIALVEPVSVGDDLLVHAGTAIASADEVGRGGERSETEP